jgi:hypothetical protein
VPVEVWLSPQLIWTNVKSVGEALRFVSKSVANSALNGVFCVAETFWGTKVSESNSRASRQSNPPRQFNAFFRELMIDVPRYEQPEAGDGFATRVVCALRYQYC